MATPINAFKDAVAALLIATTPPDRPEVPYARLTGLDESDGTAADRCFWFAQSRRNTPVSEAIGTGGPGSPSVTTFVWWDVELILRLSAEGFGVDTLEDQVNTESNLLLRRIEQNRVWPAGVIEVLTGSVNVDQDADSDDALIGLSMRVFVGETDGNT